MNRDTIMLVTPGEYIQVRRPDDPPELEFIEEYRDENKLVGTLVWHKRLIEIKPPSAVIVTGIKDETET
jgi:hypothetical protein